MFNYSNIRKFSRKWYLNEEQSHWIDLEVDESGVTYIGTDWSIQSGGGYMAGFQTFEEFFKKGPLNDMPQKYAEELEKHLIKYRQKGGAAILLKHINNIPDIVLWRAFIHLDDKPILISSIGEMGNQKEIVFYDGAITAGKHEVSFMLIFKGRDKQEEKDPFWKVDGEFTVSIEPKESEKKIIKITTSWNESENNIKTQWQGI